jgi:signal transduction histidine kinase/signal recognition particle receptor subunit beta
MARIDTAERQLTLKLVYYGPAMCGKTTNLQSLHAIVDPTRSIELRSLETEGDRTLFFDLLPLSLEDVAGFKVGIRLFTVPGQVHYNATRRLVLKGADGIVFVADSSPARMAANQDSVRNLAANLIANGIAPGTVPIVIQANKRDLPDALAMDELEKQLGLSQLGEHVTSLMPEILEATAYSGAGVLESFEAILRATMAQVHRHHQLHRVGISREKLGRALHDALAPHRIRAAVRATRAKAPSPVATAPPSASPAFAEKALDAEALLAQSVKQSLDLAEALGDQSAMSRSLKRRVQELETLNGLTRVLTRTLEPREIAQALAAAARAALPGGAASVLMPEDGALVEAALAGLTSEPLLHAGTPPLAWIVHRSNRPAFYRDLENDLALGDAEIASRLAPYCTSAVAPLRLPSGRWGLVLAHGSDPDERAGPETTRFLVAVAAAGSLALQNADRHAQILAHQGLLEAEVAARTQELRLAQHELVAAGRLKDRILSCVNHELRTPVTKLLASAQILERAKPGSMPPPSMLSNLAQQAKHLGVLLDQVLSAHALLTTENGGGSGEPGPVDLARTIEAVVFSCHERAGSRKVVVRVEVGEPLPPVIAEPGSLSLILSQLLDNAVKFTRPGTEVCVRFEAPDPGRVRVLVEDNGGGVRPEDAGRIFTEFDQGSGDPLVAKPNGLGLGLAIARRMARRLDGDVGVSASAPGRGATFWLELPAAVACASAR